MKLLAFEAGISFSFTMLKELRHHAPSILENAMKNTYSVLTKMTSGLLRTVDYQFFVREEILNRHREFLIELAEDEKSTPNLKELAVKLILLVGNMRASGEDYLIAFNLIKKLHLNINIDAELSLTKYFKEKLSVNHTKEKPKFEKNIDYKEDFEILVGLGNDPTPGNYTR
jgi:hypothetical protein